MEILAQNLNLTLPFTVAYVFLAHTFILVLWAISHSSYMSLKRRTESNYLYVQWSLLMWEALFILIFFSRYQSSLFYSPKDYIK